MGVRGVLVLFALLTLSACRLVAPSPMPEPTATPSPPATTRPSPAPADTATPRATATATHAAASTPTPNQPAPDYDEALRRPFREVDDQFPNATRYDLDLALDIEAATVSGHERLVYTNAETVPLETLYLRLFPNSPSYGGTMTVTNLMLDGQPIRGERELQGSALRVDLEPALPPEGQIELSLDFSLALPTDQHPADSREPGGGYRQLGYYEQTVALANAYPIVPVYNDEGWNIELAPSHGDAVFADVAFFDVTITGPQRMTLAASGTCGASLTGTEENTWSCIAAPMRDFNAVLRDDYQVESQDVDGVTVKSVFYAEHAEGGGRALDYASDTVRLFNARIGAYPFTELDVVETPTLAGGIEYPGLVVINRSYYADGSERMEWVVVHEVLHQWWYSLVGNDQVDEPWLDEALTQYCTLLYYEDKYGEDVASRLLESVFRRPYEQLQEAGNDKPAGLPVAAYDSSEYGPIVYQKGPLYFHELRQQVGEDAFWEILQRYFDQNRYRIATPEDWLTAVEAVTGEPYRDLYENWIGTQ